MIIDKELELSSEQAITASAASTNYLNQGAARDMGLIGRLWALFTVTETFVSAGASTLVTKLQCDSDSAFGSAKSPIMTDAIPKATLVAGYQFSLPLPVGLDEQNVRAYYEVAVANFTAGKMTCQIVDGLQKNVAYPNAI